MANKMAELIRIRSSICCTPFHAIEQKAAHPTELTSNPFTHAFTGVAFPRDRPAQKYRAAMTMTPIRVSAAT
jgi:transcriptional regulator of met regulon